MKHYNYNFKSKFEPIFYAVSSVLLVLFLLGVVFGAIDPLAEFGR